MKQNSAVIAALMVVLAFFGITSLPKNAAISSGAAAESKPTPKSKPKSKPNAKGATKTGSQIAAPWYVACDEIRSRLQPFVADGALGDQRLPGSCYENGKVPDSLEPKAASLGLHFVIATVPDPISTHLPLLFDRFVEVIQQAAQDDGYSYDSSWFPWNEPAKDNSSTADQQAVEDAQDKQLEQPGVLVFRHSLATGHDPSPYQRSLIVFVVAEQPTGGINAKQFGNSLLWMERLGTLSPARHLKILGPTFSGSVPSLARALTSGKLSSFAHTGMVRVSSGSVSSELGYQWFRTFLEDPNGLGLGTFRTALEGDSRQIDRFCQYVELQGYDLSRVALVSEDETAFGAIAGPEHASSDGAILTQPDDLLCYDSTLNKGGANQERLGPIYLYYPRDIATLRSAYEQQSIFSAKTQTSSGNTPSAALRGDLSEPASSEHDTVRTYSSQLAPLAQESLLQSMTSVLRDKRIEFIVLRSTNSLDQIFLSQFFRRSYPEARVVIDGADLLFRRGAEGNSLRGVMMLSTYPLLTWQQDWTPSLLTKPSRSISGESYRIFEDDAGEGLYVAARELFSNETGAGKVPIANYAPPAWALSAGSDEYSQRPATWISVIGQHQFWPLAVLNPRTLDQVADGTILPTSTERGDTPGPTGGDKWPMRLPVELVILLIACVVWSALHFLWCSRGSILPVPSLFRLAYFAPLLRPEHPALIAFGTLLPPLAVTAVATTSGLFTWSLGPSRGTIVTAWVLAMLASSFFSCLQNYKLPPLAAVRKKGCVYPAKWQRLAAVIASLLLVTFALLNLALVYGLTVYGKKLIPGFSLANRIPTYWRCVHLLSGVSGLMPELLLIAGLYAWFWCSLRGLALFGKDRPLLPKAADLPLSGPGPGSDPKRIMPMFSRRIAGDPVEAVALPLGKPYRWMLLPAMSFTIIIFALVLQDYALRTLGEKQFGLVMFLWVSFCIAIILADTAQLWLTWRRLRPLLMYLDRLPLRRTLSALKGLSWGSIWAMSTNSLEERYRIVSRQFESLTHLENCLKAWKPDDRLSGIRKNEVLGKVAVCHEQGLELAKWYASLFSSCRKSLDGSLKPFLKPLKKVSADHDQDRGPADSSFKKPFEGSLEPLWKFQEQLASTAGLVMQDLLMPAWQQETESLIFDRASAEKKGAADANQKAAAPIPAGISPHVLAAEEFFLLPYLGFIQNILGRIRTIVLGSLFLFVATTLAVSSYPFDPLPVLGGIFLTVFTLTGGTVIWVYAQMHRDATLSYMTNTQPGELGSKFWLQLVTFGAGPLIGLLTTLFPSITDFVSSWLLPSTQVLK